MSEHILFSHDKEIVEEYIPYILFPTNITDNLQYLYYR